jgi:hypothetical protein
MVRQRQDEPVHQIVFRWDAGNRSGNTGFGPVAWSCDPASAQDYFHSVAPLLRGNFSAGDGPDTAGLVRLERGSTVMLLRRTPRRDPGGRPGTLCHALIGSTRFLDPETCIALDDWAWAQGGPDWGEVRGELPQIPSSFLDEYAAQGRERLIGDFKDFTRRTARPLIAATAELLRDPQSGLMLLDRQGGRSACRTLMGLYGIFSGIYPDHWTYATRDTAESEMIRFAFVRRWPGSTAQGRRLTRVDPDEELADRAEELATQLVGHFLARVGQQDLMYQVPEALADGLDPGGTGSLNSDRLHRAAERALHDLKPVPSARQQAEDQRRQQDWARQQELEQELEREREHRRAQAQAQARAQTLEHRREQEREQELEQQRQRNLRRERARHAESERTREREDQTDTGWNHPHQQPPPPPPHPRHTPQSTPAPQPPGTPASQPPGAPASHLPGTPASQPSGTPAPQPPGAPASQPPGAPASHLPGTPSTQHPGTSDSHPQGAPVSQPPGTPAPHILGAPVPQPPGTSVSHRSDAPVSQPPGASTSQPPGAPVSRPPGASGTQPPPTHEPSAAPSARPPWAAGPPLPMPSAPLGGGAAPRGRDGRARGRPPAEPNPPAPPQPAAPAAPAPAGTGTMPLTPPTPMSPAEPNTPDPHWPTPLPTPTAPRRLLPNRRRKSSTTYNDLLDLLHPLDETSPAEIQQHAANALPGVADTHLISAVREPLGYRATTLLVTEAAARWPQWRDTVRLQFCEVCLDAQLFLPRRQGPAGTYPGDEVRAANAATLYRWAVQPLATEDGPSARLAELLPTLRSGPDPAARSAVRQILEAGELPGLREEVWRAVLTRGREPRGSRTDDPGRPPPEGGPPPAAVRPSLTEEPPKPPEFTEPAPVPAVPAPTTPASATHPGSRAGNRRAREPKREPKQEPRQEPKPERKPEPKPEQDDDHARRIRLVLILFALLAALIVTLLVLIALAF